jgi:LPXTG-motif cell wall-anchored protein
MDIALNDHLAVAKDENDPEIGQIITTLKNDIPDQTVIEGTFSLENAGRFLVFNPFHIAHAQDALADSMVRILVENPEVNKTENKPTTEPTITNLPQTGADNSPLQFLIIGAICLVLFLFVGFLSLRVIQTKIHKRN